MKFFQCNSWKFIQIFNCMLTLRCPRYWFTNTCHKNGHLSLWFKMKIAEMHHNEWHFDSLSIEFMSLRLLLAVGTMFQWQKKWWPMAVNFERDFNCSSVKLLKSTSSLCHWIYVEHLYKIQTDSMRAECVFLLQIKWQAILSPQ